MVEQGKIVGYIEVENSLFGMTRRANGHIVVLHSEQGLLSYRPDGTLAHSLAQAPLGVFHRRIHHDALATPSNTILFIANDTLTVDGTHVIGEGLWEWTPETGAVVKRWSAFDHLNWRTERGREGGRSIPGNWLHGNGIQFGPRGNVLMSLRNISQVISIAPGFGSVEWKLGGANPTLALPDADRFFGQHYVTEPVLNRVVVYDNGFARPGCSLGNSAGCYTRVAEYRVNPEAGTATLVKEYRHSPDIYASLVGSALRLSNGNTSVLFGMKNGDSGSAGPTDRTAVEVDDAGAVRWRLSVVSANPTRLYRLTPVSTLLGEQPGAFRGN